MSTLHIALHDGFAGDAVTIRLAGREVYRKEGVRTDLRISRADGVDAPAPEGAATVEVQARGQTVATEIDAGATPYLAVSLDADGRPEFRTSNEPFAYL
jgi:hypothetical protein